MDIVHNIASTYTLYVNDLFNYGQYLGFKKDVVMDAIHDVFCRLAENEGALKDVSNIKSYLFSCLKNRLLDIHKSKKDVVAITPDFDITNNLPFDMHINIEDKLIDKEEKLQVESLIREMLNTLTNRQREVIYLRYVQEYDYKDISELLNISVQSCRNLVSQSIKELREKYGLLLLLLALS